MSDYRLFNVFDVMREGAVGYRTVSDAVETAATNIWATIGRTGEELWKDGVFDSYVGPALERYNAAVDTSERQTNRGAAVDLCTDAGEATSAQCSALLSQV